MPPVSQHPHSRIVQSRQNARVKELRAGFSPRSRSRTGQTGDTVAIEGEHLLIEAIRSGVKIVTVFFRSGDDSILDRVRFDKSVEVIELAAEIFASAVATESPQGIAALIVPRTFSIDDMFSVERPLILVAAGLQDPGNLGTLVRSAEAFGAAGVVTLAGTVSLWNSKSLRASSGSAFRLPVVAADNAILDRLRSQGVRILAAVANEGLAAPETDLAGATAILIGNEGRGLAAELVQLADARITIPFPGPVESLNAAIAASILLYEASRQRI